MAITKVVILENGKLKIKYLDLDAQGGDPFASALFSEECDPLFEKDELGNIELLEECADG